MEIENYYVKTLAGWTGGADREVGEAEYWLSVQALNCVDVLLVSEWLDTQGMYSLQLTNLTSSLSQLLFTVVLDKIQATLD